MDDNENQATINEAASSPANSHIDIQDVKVESEPILGDPIESAGLVSTAEFEVKEVKKEAGKSAQGDDTQASAKEGDSKDSDKSKSADEKLSTEDLHKLDVTFQDSPRFKELMAERTTFKARQIKSDAQVEALSDQVQNLTSLVSGKQTVPQNQSPTYKDVLGQTDEKIIEAFETNPKDFLSNFAAQLESEIIGKVTRQSQANDQQTQAKTQEQAVKDLYDKYEKDNPDFVVQWNEGLITEYMDKNPGLTPIAAHKIMKSESDKDGSKTAQQEAIDAAVKVALEKQKTDMATKHAVRVIPAGGGNDSIKDGTPPDLANTKQHGGLTAVLAKRSAARRKAL